MPVAPLLDHFAATYSGYTNAEIMTDGDKRIEAVLKTMRELGPWDMTFLADTANALLLQVGVAIKLKLPGRDLPEDEIHQFEESEFLAPSDYDLLIEKGVVRFMYDCMKRQSPELAGPGGIWKFVKALFELRRHRKMVEEAGAVIATGFIHPGPLFEYFSFGRGLQPMSLDIYDRPEKIKQASEVWRKGMTSIAINTAKLVGEKRIFVGLSRSASEMISQAHFDEFVWPDLEYTVGEMLNAGMIPLLHADSNWTARLDLFKRLPKGKCILELDSHTDIFKAKEELAGHMCIMGDVPAYLLAFGSRDQVLDYCKNLIEKVGDGGGFILSSGCSIPANAKPENVKAMTEAVEEWGWYSKEV